MYKYRKYIGISILFFLLILVRFYEDELFYDPYLLFFKNDYLTLDSPRREVAKLVLSTTLRYVLNSLISIAVLYQFFKDKTIIKFSSYIYMSGYLVFMMLFLYFVLNPNQEDYYLFFNVRRFLIQPLILLLLLPAFYYNRLQR
ncbi:exosortase F system-associated protein [Aurantibacter sp.]|uniref:exosortase F system-associated membrane protein n=1 Tax=Aurantibacter sp. TaxID=2807103 RepID=UPI0035C828F1